MNKEKELKMMLFKLGETGAFESEFDYGKLNISSNTEIGFRPVHLLVSSIAGCSGGVFKRILEKKRIGFDTIHIEADVERNKKEVNRVTKIALHYIVYGKNLDLSQVQKSLDLAMKNCSMVETVKNSIDIVETVEVRES